MTSSKAAKAETRPTAEPARDPNTLAIVADSAKSPARLSAELGMSSVERCARRSACRGFVPPRHHRQQIFVGLIIEATRGGAHPICLSKAI